MWLAAGCALRFIFYAVRRHLGTKTAYQPPCPFGRPPSQIRTRRRGQFAHFHFSCPTSQAFDGFLVKQSCFRCGSTQCIDAADNYLPACIANHDFDFIPGFYFARRFGVLSIETYLAAFNRIGSEAACLEKPRSPKPFVDTQTGRGLSHEREAWMPRMTQMLSPAVTYQTMAPRCRHLQ